MQDEHQDRSRRLSGNQSKISKWHFASIYKADTKYKVKEVNAVGTRYALNPTEEDGLLLIKYFHGYLMKYTSLLTTGVVDGHLSNDTKRFLSLLVPKGSNQAAYYLAASRLPNAFISMTADEVYNELVSLFLELAQKFNPDIGGFTGYVQHHFRFALKARMFKVQRDPLNHQPLFDEDLDGSNIEDGQSEEDISGDQSVDTEMPGSTSDLPVLNFSFINSAPEPFNTIWTKLQRAIIVYRYYSDLSLSAISDQLGLGSTVKARELHNKAIEDYKEWMIENGAYERNAI